MRTYLLIVVSLLIFISCSHKKQLTYINNSKVNSIEKINYLFEQKIEIGDILKIEILTSIPEASLPYNSSKFDQVSNMDLLLLNGYVVANDATINYPILGQINVESCSEKDLEKKIANLLVEGGHLTNPFVKVRKLNSKFTVLGEVTRPGTFSFYDEKLNILQAIGYSGDLLITAKRTNVTIIREQNGLRKIHKLSLNKNDFLDKPFYYIKNNDVIIIEPNFSKVKSAGFIGSPASISSVASLLLSITLLIINN